MSFSGQFKVTQCQNQPIIRLDSGIFPVLDFKLKNDHLSQEVINRVNSGNFLPKIEYPKIHPKSDCNDFSLFGANFEIFQILNNPRI